MKLVGLLDYSSIKSAAKDRIFSKAVKHSLGSGIQKTSGEYAKATVSTDALVEIRGKEVVDSWLSSENKCTDGCDDGKISFWSKAGNLLEGVAKTVVGGLKNFLSDPKNIVKAVVATVAMSALYAVCPALAIGIGFLGGAKLFGDGIKTIIDGVKNAESAKTDAEAKDAWEEIGNGSFKTGVGAYVMYGCTKLVTKNYSNYFQHLLMD